MNYIALIHKEKESDYGVSFPDFPGCMSAGRTLDEAKDLAQEAIIEHLALLREMGEPIPLPSSLDDVMADPENQKALVFLVNVPSQKSVRVNVTFPEDVLKVIDKCAHDHHLSRSAFLAHIAQRYQNSDAKVSK